MTKTEFLDNLSKKGGLSRPEAEKILNAFLNAVEDALCKDGNLSIRHFGSFVVRERKERTGKHPGTGEPLHIAASKTVVFQPASNLKTCVNNQAG